MFSMSAVVSAAWWHVRRHWQCHWHELRVSESNALSQAVLLSAPNVKNFLDINCRVRLRSGLKH